MKTEEEIRKRLDSNEAWIQLFTNDLKEMDTNEPLYMLTYSSKAKCETVKHILEWILEEG